MTDLAALEKLREAFPPGTVGILPKPYKKDAERGRCTECGGYHGLPAAHLDFVGHAAVTDRLLNVDPEWSWEPFAVDERGLPSLDREGNLWIRLTVCGVTRIGVGDGPSMKERIGDSIRNAAMRFGVALSLWTKDELESGHAEEKATKDHTTRRAPPGVDVDTGEVRRASPDKMATDKQVGFIKKLAQERGLSPAALAQAVRDSLGRESAGWGDLSAVDASAVIDYLKDLSTDEGFGESEEPF